MTRQISWQQNGVSVSRPLISESEHAVPRQILLGDDTLKADDFYRKASQGAAFIYVGDFQNAKQLLQAIQRRLAKSTKKPATNLSQRDLFHRHRLNQAHRAQILSRLLISVEGDLSIPLRRAPDVRPAMVEAFGKRVQSGDGFVMSLSELLGVIGAYEWQKKGVTISALGATIHPRYGLFSPVRGEYLDLIAKAPLPADAMTAYDIGTGTGVIAAILAKRGVPRIIATDVNPRAVDCARDNILKLGFVENVEIRLADMFDTLTEADLIVCNPPWVPARPTSSLELAVYDQNSQMLKTFLNQVTSHLTVKGEGWLILSNLAELLQLRGPNELSELIEKAGLQIIEILEAKPTHPKTRDEADPLLKARANEVTRLYRLKKI